MTESTDDALGQVLDLFAPDPASGAPEASPPDLGDTADPGRQADLAVRDALQRTWYPFFSRFPSLTATQREAIPPLLDGIDVLLVAPTASGKTEAFMAPLLERTLRSASDAVSSTLRIIVIAPTRALCNDLHRRLETPLRRAGVTLGRRTADARELDPDAPPTVLITTPESLDSLLGRHPEVLVETDAIVLDEIHLLAASPRGDQLRILLERLDRTRRAARPHAPPLQRCGASASVAGPEALARRFCGPRAEVRQPAAAPRSIALTVVDAPTSRDIAEALLRARQEAPGRKRLLFVNRRADAEGLATLLRPHLPAMVHHGSIARDERLRVERRFQQEREAVCIATSTLEIGIDIGDVDEAWLAGPPPDVAAYLQRVGRANRRGTTVQAVGLAGNAFEAARLRHLNHCAAQGRLHDVLTPLRPAVVAQQALTLCLQNRGGWIDEAALAERLPDDSGLDRQDLNTLLSGLVAAGYLERSGRRWRLGDKAEDERRSGRLHTTFAAPLTVPVRDELSGRTIGELSLKAAENLDRGTRLTLGGRHRDVQRVARDGITVREAGGDGAHHFLSRDAPSISAGLACDFRDWLGYRPGDAPTLPVPDDGARVFHFGGSARGILLAEALATMRGSAAVSSGPFALTMRARCLTQEHPLGDPDAVAARLRTPDEGIIRALERVLEPGRLARAVPLPLRRRWVLSAVDIPGFLAWHAALRPLPMDTLPLPA